MVKIILLVCLILIGIVIVYSKPVSPNVLSGFEALLIIVLAGAFGGFVDGLSTRKPYALSFKGKSTDIGFLGDIFVGSTASIAIFTVAGAVFGINDQWVNIGQPEVFLKIVAWGVLSGYVGIRLLNPLSAKLVKEIADNAAKKVVQETADVNWGVDLYVQEGNQSLSDYDQLLKEFDLDLKTLINSPKADEARNYLKEAGSQFDMALDLDAISREAIRGKARMNRRVAELSKAEGKTSESIENWKSAIQLLTGIILRDSNSAFALYNRACYRLLSGATIDLVLEDLELAINIHVQLKGRAIRDPDFQNLRDNKNKQFEDLVS